LPLQVALVGAGQVAQVHLQALAGTDAVDVVGIFDQDQARARAAATANAVPLVYADWSALLNDTAVECVAILLPHDLHAQFTIEALQAGKHVVCEKPLGRSMAEMQRMLQAASDGGRSLLPVHNRLYSPGVERLLEVVGAGHIGEVILAQTTGFEGPLTVGVRPWLATPRGGGGVLIAQAVHPAYILRALLGDVARVSCQFGDLKVVDMTSEDTAVAILKFRSGAIAEMTATFGIAHGPFEHSIILHGREGYAALGVSDPNTSQRDSLKVISPSRFGDMQVHDIDVTHVDALTTSFRRLWEDYARGITENAPTRVNGEDGKAAVEIILAAYRSAATGRAVDLPLPVE
jgi:UDP-N-acetyl-2-amino-2-deoxyglucuronate dehydrogenase